MKIWLYLYNFNASEILRVFRPRSRFSFQQYLLSKIWSPKMQTGYLLIGIWKMTESLFYPYYGQSDKDRDKIFKTWENYERFRAILPKIKSAGRYIAASVLLTLTSLLFITEESDWLSIISFWLFSRLIPIVTVLSAGLCCQRSAATKFLTRRFVFLPSSWNWWVISSREPMIL